MKKITTVRGDIAPEQLGKTNMHDHIFLDVRECGLEKVFGNGIPAEKLKFVPENYIFLKTGVFIASKELQYTDDLGGMVKEYNYLAEAGFQSVVDPTPTALRGDIHDIVAVSERTGLNIITATGNYHEYGIPASYRNRGVDFYYNMMKDEIENGIAGTDAHPGLLKTALTCMSQTELDVMEACARLTAETGLCIYIHISPTSVDNDKLVEFLNEKVKQHHIAPERIVVCHMDGSLVRHNSVAEYVTKPEVNRTVDVSLPKALMDCGYNVGLDNWGMPFLTESTFMADDFERMKALVTLIDQGYENQIVLGNDLASQLQWRAYGGFGCTRFVEFALPMLEKLGRGGAIQKLICENPARILSY